MSRDTHRSGDQERPDRADAITRRRILQGAAGGASVAAAGCVGWVDAAFGDDAPNQVTLSIKTVPADTDRRSMRIARYLAKRLDAVGIDAHVVPMSLEELRRDVLVNHDFDLYVDRHPERHDPDFLRTMLNSRFGPEAGWQNPFGYADLDMDDLLAVQRRQSGRSRTVTLRNTQSSIVNNQPFSVVAFPTELRIARTDRFRGWDSHGVHSPLGYLSLDPIPESERPWRSTSTETATPSRTGSRPSAEPAVTETRDGTPASGTRRTATDRVDTATGRDQRVAGTQTVPTDSTIPARTRRGELRVATIDERMTENLNPIAGEFRQAGAITGLLYDPLARVIDGEISSWLAAGWEWDDDPDGSLTATVSLREDLTWHDGSSITAEDVAFTHRFLQDTSLGGLATATPATRFRGRNSLVRDVNVVDERTVELSFGRSSEAVAARSLTVPILPEHVWRSRTAPADPRWLSDNVALTEAQVWANPNPVGSGPFQFESWSRDVHLTLTSFADHFLEREDLPAHLEPYGTMSIERLRFDVVPSTRTAASLTLDGAADATATDVRPSEVPTDLPSHVELYEEEPAAFYHVGYNTRQSPLSNPRFRRAIARLLDKSYLVDTAFEGYARPAASPLARHEANAPWLAWTGRDPELPFPGEDGDLNPSRARAPFRRAGYRYGEDGALLVR